MRKNLLLASALGFGLTMSGFAMAAEEAAPAPAYTLTYNIGLFSGYQFRGLEQTGGRAALQGGADWTHSSGFYVGTWGSNISWLEENQTYQKSSLEIDLYGGYKNTIGSTGIGYDIGLLGYYYPGEKVDTTNTLGFYTARADTVELKAGLSYDWFSLTSWWIATKNGLGTADAQGSYYIDATANIPIADTGLVGILHVGRQHFIGGGGANDPYSYTDYKAGLSKAWDNGVTLGGYYTDTTADQALYTYQSNYWGDKKVTVFVQKTF